MNYWIWLVSLVGILSTAVVCGTDMFFLTIGRPALRLASACWFYLASLLMLILFVIVYNRLSKPINQLRTQAAKTGERLNNGRELQASWDRSVMVRVPLLVVSLLAQCLVLLIA